MIPMVGKSNKQYSASQQAEETEREVALKKRDWMCGVILL